MIKRFQSKINTNKTKSNIRNDNSYKDRLVLRKYQYQQFNENNIPYQYAQIQQHDDDDEYKQILTINKYQPLRQLSHNNHNRMNLSIVEIAQKQKHHQKELKSQSSLNDLSAITSIQMSCSSKKYDFNNNNNNHHLLVEFMENFDKMQKQHQRYININDNINIGGAINNTIKGQLQYNNNQTNSIHQAINNIQIKDSNNDDDDEFEILDIYATSVLNIEQTVNRFKQNNSQQQKITRKTGCIKRNCTPSVHIQNQSVHIQNHSVPIYNQTQTQSVNKYSQPQQKTRRQTSLRNETQKHSSNNNVITFIQKPHITIKNKQKRQKQNNITIVHQQQQQKTIYKLFYAISQNNMTISHQQIQNFPFTCQFKLLLGPVLSKYRINRYTNLDFTEFNKQFTSILNDFCQQEKLNICQKINKGKFVTKNEQNINLKRFKGEGIFSYSHEENDKYQYKNVHEQQADLMIKNSTQDRLLLLNSKVDTYLTRINQQQLDYNNNNQPTYLNNQQTYIENQQTYLQNQQTSIDNQQKYHNNNYNQLLKKQKLSTLMSRLSQIEQISGDSDDLLSKNQSSSYRYRDQMASNICPNKNVYVNDQMFYFDDEQQKLVVDYVEQQRLRQSDKQISRNYIGSSQSQLNSQQTPFQRYTTHTNRRQKNQIQSRIMIGDKKQHSNSLTQSRTNHCESKRSSLTNSRSNYLNDVHYQHRRLQTFNPFIISQEIEQQRLQQRKEEETLYHSSLKSINLSFCQLEKYLQ